MNTARDRGKRAPLEENYTMTPEERQENQCEIEKKCSKQTSEIRQRCENEAENSEYP